MIDVLACWCFDRDPFAPSGNHSPRLAAYIRRMKKWVSDRRVVRLYGPGVLL